MHTLLSQRECPQIASDRPSQNLSHQAAPSFLEGASPQGLPHEYEKQFVLVSYQQDVLANHWRQPQKFYFQDSRHPHLHSTVHQYHLNHLVNHHSLPLARKEIASSFPLLVQAPQNPLPRYYQNRHIILYKVPRPQQHLQIQNLCQNHHYATARTCV